MDTYTSIVLTYGCEIWGHHNLETIERFHLGSLKKMLRVSKYTSNAIVYGETGSFDINVAISKRMIQFWNSLKLDNQNKISCILMKFSTKLYDSNIIKTKWLLKIREIIIQAGLPYLWDLNRMDSRTLKKMMDKRLNDTFRQGWLRKIDESRLCVNYRLIKDKHEFEHYLKTQETYIRIPLTKYRCGSHFLPISNKRYDDLDNRNNCPLCSMNTVGDEYHYVMECPAFLNHRAKYVNPYFTKRPNILKYMELFSSRSKLKLLNLSKFVTEIMYVFRI